MALTFRRLPVNPDEGLPQRFTLAVGARGYEVTAYASLRVDPRDPPETLYDLSSPERPATPLSPPGYLVLRIDRQGPGGRKTIFLRKVAPDPVLIHEAEELAVTVRRVRLARGNLNGRGQLGSEIVIGLAERWA